MPSTIALKRKITSVRNTRQITKAMQLVSASKMKRAQDYAFRSRDYREAAYELLERLSSIPEVEQQPLFKRRGVRNRLYIVVTSNSGLAGAYNANVLKQLTTELQKDREGIRGESQNLAPGLSATHTRAIKSHVITIGSKGTQFVRRLSDVDLLAVYPALGDQPSANDVRPVLNTILDQYKDEHVDDVRVIYTQFKSNLVQEVQTLQLLPATKLENVDAQVISNFEPDVETVVGEVTTRLIEAQVWQAVLESLASEHSMRMIAMKNATDNANELIDDYTLEYNTARQAGITQELAEITGGAEALNG